MTVASWMRRIGYSVNAGLAVWAVLVVSDVLPPSGVGALMSAWAGGAVGVASVPMERSKPE